MKRWILLAVVVVVLVGCGSEAERGGHVPEAGAEVGYCEYLGYIVYRDSGRTMDQCYRCEIDGQDCLWCGTAISCNWPDS